MDKCKKTKKDDDDDDDDDAANDDDADERVRCGARGEFDWCLPSVFIFPVLSKSFANKE